MASALSFADACLTPYDRARQLLSQLPHLKRETVPLDECCPICLLAFRTFFDEDAVAASEGGSASADDCGNDRGVTKLVGCNHVFCRKDLNEWILGLHGTCPICRHRFLDIKPPSESDDESSDGGEWLPTNSDIDDEDVFMEPDTDAFTDDADEDAFDGVAPDTELGLGDYDMEWEEKDEVEVDSDEDWGLTDRDTSMSSEGEFASIEEEVLEDDNTGIHDGDDAEASVGSPSEEAAK